MKITFTTSHQRDNKTPYIDYRGPSLDDAYSALTSARENVDAGNFGYVTMYAHDHEQGTTTNLVFEQTGTDEQLRETK